MELTTVIFLGMGMVSILILMAIIIFGTRKSSEYKDLEKVIGNKAGKLDADTKALWEALKKSEAEKEQILNRLKNLETIVTSEAWEAIRKAEEKDEIKLHLEDDEPEELNDADKAERIARKVR